MYEGSAARRIDANEEFYAARARQRSLGVVEGEGLDARARAGVAPAFLAKLKIAAFVGVVLMALCFVRVGVYAATTGILMENNSMRTELKDATATRDELRIERSVLSSSSRIERIATQTYGMVMAEGAEVMQVGAAAQAAEEAAAAEAAAAEAAAAEATAAEAAAAETTAAQAAAEETAAEETPADQSVAEPQEALADTVINQATMTQGDGSTAGANAVDMNSL